jgi:hypothetical protein
MTRGQINKKEALLNIQKKTDILRDWSKGIYPHPLVSHDYFPTTIRQFNHWDMSQNTQDLKCLYPTIKTNANDTLRSYPQLRNEIEQIISLLILKSKQPSNKIEKASRLKEKIDQQNKYILILERHTALQQLELTRLTSEQELQKIKYKNIINEMKKNIDQQEKCNGSKTKMV